MCLSYVETCWTNYLKIIRAERRIRVKGRNIIFSTCHLGATQVTGPILNMELNSCLGLNSIKI